MKDRELVAFYSMVRFDVIGLCEGIGNKIFVSG